MSVAEDSCSNSSNTSLLGAESPNAMSALDFAPEDEETIERKLYSWGILLRDCSSQGCIPSPLREEPYKNIYASLEAILPVQKQIISLLKNFASNSPIVRFRLHFAIIHVTSALAKWYEQCEEYGLSEKLHKQCLTYIDEVLETYKEAGDEEVVVGLKRCHLMQIYEHIRYAIVCSERDKQSQALDLLVKAEDLFHTFKKEEDPVTLDPYSLLKLLDAQNSDTLDDMFTYLLFYLGQAYKISGAKEKAVLYLHMVLRRELEKADVDRMRWASDASKMATVLVTNLECFEAARNILLAATTVLNACGEEQKKSDTFQQNYAELGRSWAKLGNELLEASADRLKDLEEQARKAPKFLSKLSLRKSEIQSLGIECYQDEYDTILLLRSLRFPTLDNTEVEEREMRGKYVRDFDEARAVFLPLQRWINVAKSYYKIDEFASDYIDIVTDYSNAFKHLAFFEPCLQREIKMHKRRVLILEELLSNLNPKIYADVFHFVLRELAEINERIYKLKVSEIKERGESLRPKDRKLVKWLTDAVLAHKRNLTNFGFDLDNPTKDFETEYQKACLGSVLSIGRILGSISHDHPLHPEAIEFAREGKRFYEFFLQYLDQHKDLKLNDFKVLYEGTRDMPDLMDKQIRKISAYADLNLNM